MAEHSFSAEDFTVETVDGKINIIPKRKYVSKKDIMNAATYSTIQECLVQKDGKVISTDNHYQTILKKIWKTLDVKKLRETTHWVIMLGDQQGYKGYDYWEEMRISFCGRDSNETLKEILKMCDILKMTISLTIQTKDGTVLHYKG